MLSLSCLVTEVVLEEPGRLVKELATVCTGVKELVPGSIGFTSADTFFDSGNFES